VFFVRFANPLTGSVRGVPSFELMGHTDTGFTEGRHDVFTEQKREAMGRLGAMVAAE
jgi:hypothetical protein